MADGLQDHARKLPLVATAATAVADKAWIPIAVLQVVWIYMLGRSSLPAEACTQLAKLVVDAWGPVVPNSVLPAPVTPKDKDAAAAADKVCVISDDMIRAYSLFQQLHDIVSMPSFYLAQTDPYKSMMDTVRMCLTIVDSSAHAAFKAVPIDKLYKFKEQLRKLLHVLIPHASTDGTNAKFFELIKICGKWWNIKAPDGIDEEITFMGKSKIISRPDKSDKSPDRSNRKDNKRKKTSDEKCALCQKTHQSLDDVKCRRCGNASHTVATCRAGKDVCGKPIEDNNGDGRKYKQYV